MLVGGVQVSNGDPWTAVQANDGFAADDDNEDPAHVGSLLPPRLLCPFGSVAFGGPLPAIAV